MVVKRLKHLGYVCNDGSLSREQDAAITSSLGNTNGVMTAEVERVQKCKM